MPDGPFDEHHKRFDAWYDKHRAAYLSELQAVRKALPPHGTGLEVGVGTGRFAGPLGIAKGIDPSEKMVAAAVRRGVDAIVGRGEALPFPDDGFDHVAIIVTICFADDPVRVIEEASRVLKPGGRLVVGIVDKESFLGKIYSGRESVFYRNARFFSVREISGMMQAGGLTGIGFYQTIFSDPDSMTAVDEVKKGSGTGGFVVVYGNKPLRGGKK